ncbi:MAG: hypothetical protein ACXVCP_02270 [Bdellovibrio sp.]
MEKILFALSLLIGSSAFASNGYVLKMELSMNGKKVSSPRIIVLEGEAGSVTQETPTEKTFIEVVAKEGAIQNHKGILINFVVGYIGQDGKRNIVSKPQILAKENETAQVSVGENGKETMSLSVVAQRKSL